MINMFLSLVCMLYVSSILVTSVISTHHVPELFLPVLDVVVLSIPALSSSSSASSAVAKAVHQYKSRYRIFRHPRCIRQVSVQMETDLDYYGRCISYHHYDSLYQGLQARSLTAQVAETDAIRFLVGTQSLKYDNQVHVLDFDEDNNALNKTVFFHKDGEIWHIGSSPGDKDILSTCFNKIVDNKLQGQAAIWRLPTDDEDPDIQDVGLHDDTSSNAKNLEVLCRLDNSDMGNIISVLWEPQGDGNRILSLTDNKFLMWDLEASGSSARMTSSATLEGKGHPKFTSLRWNPHHNNSQVASANDTTIRGWDLRSMEQTFMIENAHGQLVRDLDFNPNKQYFMASCGDDCSVKFWDVRNTERPVMVQNDHSHWVWSVRYNQFHDQLILSSSSDSRVILTNASSISSEPFGHMDEDDEEEEEDDDIMDNEEKSRSKEPMKDGVIATYEEHEDSVYAAEWSMADPWLFASLSYDGRLVINRVPRAEKYKILL